MSLGTLRGFAFDLDGCIWAGETLLPGAAELVQALRAAGHRVLFSIGKSDRPLFELALERMACRPAEAAMVGDSLATDVAGGRDAGMLTIWVEPEGNGDGEGRADLVVRSLELRELWVKDRG